MFAILLNGVFRVGKERAIEDLKSKHPPPPRYY